MCERKEERNALLCLASHALDVGLERLVAYDDAVFLGKMLYMRDQMRRIDDVQREHAEEIADHKRKGQVVRQPVERREHMRMDKKIIHGAEYGPEEGKQRTDQPLDVAPAAAVIPQPHPAPLQQCKPGDVFDGRHACGHHGEKQQLARHVRAETAPFAQRGQQIQDAQPAAVQRHVRPDTETGIEPFMLRVRRGKEFAEKHFQHPAENRTDEKKISKTQKQTHNRSSFLPGIIEKTGVKHAGFFRLKTARRGAAHSFSIIFFSSRVSASTSFFIWRTAS